jgi:hypothetical protein
MRILVGRRKDDRVQRSNIDMNTIERETVDLRDHSQVHVWK